MAGYVFLVLAVDLVLFVVVRYVVWGRRWATERNGREGRLESRSPRGPSERADADAEKAGE